MGFGGGEIWGLGMGGEKGSGEVGMGCGVGIWGDLLSSVWSPGISLPNALQRIVFKESADFLTKCNAIHRVVW